VRCHVCPSEGTSGRLSVRFESARPQHWAVAHYGLAPPAYGAMILIVKSRRALRAYRVTSCPGARPAYAKQAFARSETPMTPRKPWPQPIPRKAGDGLSPPSHRRWVLVTSQK
jgi:hypothetical protein